MKKVLVVAAAMGGMLLMGGQAAWALSSETTMLLELLKAKGVITQQDAAEFTKTLEAKAPEAAKEAGEEHHHTVQSLSERLEKLEGEKSGEGLAGVANHVKVGGRLEVDMTAARAKDAAGEKTSSSDVILKTAQLSADATVNQYVTGRIALLYEEGENNDNIALDEAIVGLKGGEALPVYANLGRMYVPFGQFKSHFISDPMTKILGETNDTAVVAGYANDIVDLNAGFFKGKVKETGRSEHINSTVASATLTLPKGKGSEEGFAMKGGVSYLSNLATSDTLEPETTVSGEVGDTAGGLSAFLSMSYAERFFFDAEYLGALSNFDNGDFNFADAKSRKPQTWNLEAAARLNKETEFALRYGGSSDESLKNSLAHGGDKFILADHEYGAALLYEIFEHTTLTVEYLFQEFQDDSNNSKATMQVAVEF